MGKPIIGLVGGVGSGKSFVARIFAEFGCHVIDSDAHSRAAFNDPEVQAALREWWGPAVFLSADKIDRQAIARKVFADPAERRRLEALIHPWVDRARNQEMKIALDKPAVLAFVWDSPLLFEAGLDGQCDAVVFVEAPEPIRLGRVGQTRGWGADELIRRENSQWPLDKKRELSDYVLKSTADAAQVRDQVRLLLPRIIESTNL